jgi:hypothetical protein
LRCGAPHHPSPFFIPTPFPRDCSLDRNTKKYDAQPKDFIKASILEHLKRQVGGGGGGRR